ncbi:glycosyl transferase [Candidatus Saccharibacteria bacterium]|nr:glycosyl transferase [Candidatus Saccharibacteria bacterium]
MPVSLPLPPPKKSVERIPRKIHYIWVGDKPLPEADKKRINHWRKLHPDYEIKLWNEKNFDIESNYWTREAYKAKRFALVADVIRIHVLKAEGGIYLDTDMELLRPLDDLLQYEAFLSYDSNHWTGSSILGTVAGSTFIQRVWRRYDTVRGKISAGNTMKTFSCLGVLAGQTYGVKLNGCTQEKNGFAIFERHVFSPKHYATGRLQMTTQTRGIHHFASSWHDQFFVRASTKLTGIAYKILGEKVMTVVFESPMLLCIKTIFWLEERQIRKVERTRET